jgi:hypothetical protein
MGLQEFVVRFSSKKPVLTAETTESDIVRYFEINFPEALQNFADRICEAQRKICDEYHESGHECNIDSRGTGTVIDNAGTLPNSGQPKIEEL